MYNFSAWLQLLLSIGTLEEEDNDQLELDSVPAITTLHYEDIQVAITTLLSYEKKIIIVEGALANNHNSSYPKNNIYLLFVQVYNALLKMDETKLEEYKVEKVNLPTQDDPELQNAKEQFSALVDALKPKHQEQDPLTNSCQDDEGVDEKNLDYETLPFHGDM